MKYISLLYPVGLEMKKERKNGTLIVRFDYLVLKMIPENCDSDFMVKSRGTDVCQLLFLWCVIWTFMSLVWRSHAYFYCNILGNWQVRIYWLTIYFIQTPSNLLSGSLRFGRDGDKRNDVNSSVASIQCGVTSFWFCSMNSHLIKQTHFNAVPAENRSVLKLTLQHIHSYCKKTVYSLIGELWTQTNCVKSYKVMYSH